MIKIFSFITEQTPFHEMNRSQLDCFIKTVFTNNINEIMICNVRPQDVVTTRFNELLARLNIEDLDLILKERRLRWYGHVECSSGAMKTAFHIQVEGKHGPGRPKMTWKQLTERDCREWKLSLSTLMTEICGDLVWESQLSRRGPTDVDVAPVPAC